MNEWYKKFTDKSIVMKEEDRIKGLYQFTSDVSRYYHPDDIPNLHLKPNYYFLSDEAGNCMTSLFRVSHIQNYRTLR